MIEIKELSLQLDNKTVFARLNIEFEKGAVSGVIGPSGSGKSRLLSAISGFDRGYSGDIYIDKRPLPSLKRNELTELITFYSGLPPDNMEESLFDFIKLSRSINKKLLQPLPDHEVHHVEEYIDAFELSNYRDMALKKLPASIFKRALLAFFFARKAQVLLLDEPVAGLDIYSQSLLHKEIQRYTINGDRYIIITSGDLNLISQCSDRIYILKEGSLTMKLAPEEITAEIIKDVFNVEVLVSRNIYNGRPEVHLFPGQ